MPRNASGVYSLPDPPRVPATVIDSPDENTTRNDIGAELTNSLDRNGRGGMLAPFRIADGTLAAPGLAFLNEPGSGIYRIGPGDWALALQGAKMMEFTANTVTIPAGVALNMGSGSVVRIADGLVGAPSLAFLNDLDNGIYRVNPDDWAMSAGGVKVMELQPTAVTITAPGLNIANALNFLASATVQQVNFYTNADAEIVHRNGVGNVNIYAAGVLPGLRITPTPGATVWLTVRGGNPNPVISTSSGDALLVGTSVQINGNLFAVGGAIFQSPGNIPNVLGSNTAFDAVDNLNITGTIAGIAIHNSRAGGSNNWSIIRNTAGATNSNFEFLVGTGLALNLGHDKSAVFFGPVIVQPAKNLYFDGGINTSMQEVSADTLITITGGVERVRVTASGFLKASNSGTYSQVAGVSHEMFSDSNAGAADILLMKNAAATVANQYGIALFLNNDPNNTQYFFNGIGNATSRFSGRANGGLANFQANDVNLSDAAVKEYIEPIAGADAIELWNAHRDVEWCSFKYHDQTHSDPNFGYVAQDIERCFAKVAPWLVDEENWGTKENPVMRKSVYATDLDNIGHAVLSAAQRRIEALEAALTKNGITIN